MPDDSTETLLANLAAIAAGQQLLLDRLLRVAPDAIAHDLELQQVAHDVSDLLIVTRDFLRRGPPGGNSAN